MSNRSVRYFIGFLITILISQCDTSKHYSEEESQSDSEILSERKIQYKTIDLEEKMSPCINDECTMVTISFPEIAKKEPGAETINKTLEATANQMIQDMIPPGAGTGKNIKQNMQAFVKSYQEFKEAFPEVNTPWTVDIDVSLSYQGSNFTSFEIASQSYTGGAHPNSSVNYLNFDHQGKTIKGLSYFIKSEEKLKQIAEQEFRKLKQIKENQSLSDAGFTFDNDQFSLAETFGFSEKGMVFYYNSYEIAAYADGPTELILSFDKIKEIMN